MGRTRRLMGFAELLGSGMVAGVMEDGSLILQWGGKRLLITSDQVERLVGLLFLSRRLRLRAQRHYAVVRFDDLFGDLSDDL